MILKSIEFVNFMSANHFEKNPVGFYVLGYPVLPNVPFNYVYISFTWLPFTL